MCKSYEDLDAYFELHKEEGLLTPGNATPSSTHFQNNHPSRISMLWLGIVLD